MKTIAILAAGILALLPAARAQVAVEVIADAQGAMSYVQDAVNQVQTLQQWASQYTQMAQQIQQFDQQIQQYQNMLTRMGDPSSIIGATGLQNLTGQTQGLLGQFQQYGSTDYWTNATGVSSLKSSLTGGMPSLNSIYGNSLNPNNFSLYSPVGQAFTAYNQSADKARQAYQGGISSLNSLTAQADAAQDEATVAKTQAGLIANQTAMQAAQAEAQQRFNDLQAAAIARQTEEDQRLQAEAEDNYKQAAALRAQQIQQESQALRQYDQTRSKAVRGSGQPVQWTPANIK